MSDVVTLQDGSVTIVYEEHDDGSSSQCAVLATEELAVQYIRASLKSKPSKKFFTIPWQVHTSLDSFSDNDDIEVAI